MTIHLAVAVAATCGAGFLMLAGGLQKHLLERTRSGTCPTCGRRLERRRCTVCSRPVH